MSQEKSKQMLTQNVEETLLQSNEDFKKQDLPVYQEDTRQKKTRRI